MKVLTEDALLMCGHPPGTVQIAATQDLVTVDGRRVLVETDPENRPISMCPNVGPTIKPCTSTLTVQEGYSAFVRVEGRRVCLESVTGLTDGTPPGTVKYGVHRPGQDLISEVA